MTCVPQRIDQVYFGLWMSFALSKVIHFSSLDCKLLCGIKFFRLNICKQYLYVLLQGKIKNRQNKYRFVVVVPQRFFDLFQDCQIFIENYKIFSYKKLTLSVDLKNLANTETTQDCKFCHAPSTLQFYLAGP